MQIGPEVPLRLASHGISDFLGPEEARLALSGLILMRMILAFLSGTVRASFTFFLIAGGPGDDNCGWCWAFKALTICDVL